MALEKMILFDQGRNATLQNSKFFGRKLNSLEFSFVNDIASHEDKKIRKDRKNVLSLIRCSLGEPGGELFASCCELLRMENKSR